MHCACSHRLANPTNAYNPVQLTKRPRAHLIQSLRTNPLSDIGVLPSRFLNFSSTPPPQLAASARATCLPLTQRSRQIESSCPNHPVHSFTNLQKRATSPSRLASSNASSNRLLHKYNHDPPNIINCTLKLPSLPHRNDLSVEPPHSRQLLRQNSSCRVKCTSPRLLLDFRLALLRARSRLQGRGQTPPSLDPASHHIRTPQEIAIGALLSSLRRLAGRNQSRIELSESRGILTLPFCLLSKKHSATQILSRRILKRNSLTWPTSWPPAADFLPVHPWTTARRPLVVLRQDPLPPARHQGFAVQEI